MTYTPAQLEAAFDLVKNQADWRAPIDAVVPKADEAVVCEAIVYYTGGGVEFIEELPNGKLRIVADGYRMGPCGP